MPWWAGFKIEDKEDLMGNVLWREMDQQKYYKYFEHVGHVFSLEKS